MVNLKQRAWLLLRPPFLRRAFAFFRRFAPTSSFGKVALVTRYLDVVEVLEHSGDFTISQTDGPNIETVLQGKFILGMDPGPDGQYEREKNLLLQVVRQSDLPNVRAIVAREAQAAIDAARPNGRIDIVQDYARRVCVRLIREYYGVPIPADNEAQMGTWICDAFRAVFGNFFSEAAVKQRGIEAGEALTGYLRVVIETGAIPPSDSQVLPRMIALRNRDGWPDNDTIRRNVGGIMAAMIDNTATLLAFGMIELLRRPEEAQRARDAALAGDVDLVRRYVYEAARFNPSAPLLARFASSDTVLAAGTSRQHKIRNGTTLILGNISALFDEDAFDEPDSFDIDHDSESLLFGHGLHRCLGLYINRVQMPELAAALLRLPNLHLKQGFDSVLYDGPFPSSAVMEFGE